jgi:NAD(P)-dependent dehydrogenase (short-subunit alcohol dehydrogenase family)
MAESVPQRLAVVTGASSGIGLHTAIGLARTGMRVVMAGRNRDRTEAARRLVCERSGSDRIDIALADFSRLGDLRRLADEILAEYGRQMYSSTMPACFRRITGFRRTVSS